MKNRGTVNYDELHSVAEIDVFKAKFSYCAWDHRPLPCLHRLKEGLRQSLVCSFVGNHEEVQHQRQSYPTHQKPL